MSLKKLNQSGATHLLIVLAVVVIAAVAFAGYRVMSADSSDKTATPAVSDAQSDSFQSAADIDQASKDLDNENIDQTLDSSELDNDMNDLL